MAEFRDGILMAGDRPVNLSFESLQNTVAEQKKELRYLRTIVSRVTSLAINWKHEGHEEGANLHVMQRGTHGQTVLDVIKDVDADQIGKEPQCISIGPAIIDQQCLKNYGHDGQHTYGGVFWE